MMLVTTKEMFEIAQKENFAIPAPDFYDSHSAQAYVQVAEELNMPLSLSSRNLIPYFPTKRIITLLFYIYQKIL